MQKNKEWRPNANLVNLNLRAKMLAEIRTFFQERNILEVETPLMCTSAATDPYLKPISIVSLQREALEEQKFYLQTSPEFAMKRLLAAGSGPIYQICKAFRDGEVGRLHNPEFTILEWYRPGFDHHDLMDEVETFLGTILGTPNAERLTYEAVFTRLLGFNPHHASLQQLKDCAVSEGISIATDVANTLTIDDWLDLLMTHSIEPHLGFECPVMIYDYPASKAALAKIRPGKPEVAERFEVYIQGIELANGYHELTDPEIQLARFEDDCRMRETLGYLPIPIDLFLVEALKAGLPTSAGVALGVDRLLMLKHGTYEIQDVVAFTIDRV